MSNQTPDFYSLAETEETDFFAVDEKENPIPDFYAISGEEEKPTEEVFEYDQVKVPPPDVELGKPQEKPSKLKEFLEKDTLGIGQAGLYASKSGGYSGAPALEPHVAKKVAVEVGTIATMEALLAPVYGAAAAAKYAPKILTAVARLTGAGATGAAVATTGSLAETGELPSKEELIKNGLVWTAVDATMQALHLGTDFTRSIGNIAKKTGQSRTQVLGQLWKATKNWAKQKFGKTIVKPEDVTPQAVEELVKKANEAEKAAIAIKPEKPVETKEKLNTFEDPKAVKKTIDNIQKEIKELENKKFQTAEDLRRLKILKKVQPGYEDLLQELEAKEGTEKKAKLSGLKKTDRRKIAGGNEVKIQQPKAKVEKPDYAKQLEENIENEKKLINKNIKEDEKLVKAESLKAEEREKAQKRLENNKQLLDPKFIEEYKQEFLKDPEANYSMDLVDYYTKKRKSSVPKSPQKKAKRIEGTEQEKKRYHGSPVKLKKAETGHYSTFNYYGHGFYTTDSYEVSKGYSQRKTKGEKDPTIYEVIEERPLKIYDMEKAVPSTLIKQLEKFDNSELVDMILTDPEQGLRRAFDDFRDESELSADDIQEDFALVTEQLEKLGYNGMKHIGGLRTKNKPHEVTIYFDPEKDIKIKRHLQTKQKPQQPEISKQEKTKPLASTSTQPSQPSKAIKKPVIGKKQAKKRSDIIKLFREDFQDPIRMGKMTKSQTGIKLGEHKLWEKVTRLLKANDVETAAHEIGHNLHTLLYGGNAKTPTQLDKNIIKGLKPYEKELAPLGDYEPYTMEGFAEFTRMFVTNPDAAQALAPKYYDHFMALMQAKEPKLLEGLLKARDYYDDYLQGTPESRIEAQLQFSEDKTAIDAIKGFFGNLNVNAVKHHLLDELFPIKLMVAEAFGIKPVEVETLVDEANLYKDMRLLKGGVGKAEVFLKHETFDALTLKKTGEALLDIYKPIKKDFVEFNVFVAARRALEKGGQNVATGISRADAQYVVNKYSKKYDSIVKRLDAYLDNVLDYLYKAELISAEDKRKIKENNLMYVPFFRVMEEDVKNILGTSKSYQAKNPIKRMKGSTRDIYAPLESIIKLTEMAIINAEKNMTGLTLAKLAIKKGMGKYVERVPTPVQVKAKLSKEEIIKTITKQYEDMGMEVPDSLEYVADVLPDFFMKFGAGTYAPTENIVTVYKNGKRQYYEVDPAIYEVWKKGTDPYTTNLVTKILKQPAKWLRTGAILNPKFITKNMIRDTLESFLFTQYSVSPIKHPVQFFIDTFYLPLSMLSEAAKKGPLYVEWLKSGGAMSTMQSLDRHELINHKKGIKEFYTKQNLIKWMRWMAEVSEEANRLAEYSRAISFEVDTKLGKQQAAYASRDLSIDFAKYSMLSKFLNQVTAFFNPTIQGMDKLFRTLANKKTRAPFLARTLAFITIPSLILAWLNQDDEEIEELQEQEKDQNFIFRMNGNIKKIPVPFEPGIASNGLTRRMFNYFIKHDPEAFEGFMGTLLDAGLPSFIPTFFLPYFETEANKNFFTGGRIVPPYKERLVSRLQYQNYTSLTARMLGRAINLMVGSDTYSKAASPAVIDHYIHTWTGGLGRMVIELLDTTLSSFGAGDEFEKPFRPITDRLGLDAFAVRYPRASTKSIEKFYDNYQDAIGRELSLKHAEKYQLEGDEDLIKAEDRIENLFDIQSLKAAYRAIQNNQKAINEIVRDKELNAKEKREMIDELYRNMIEFAKAANENMREYRKEIQSK